MGDGHEAGARVLSLFLERGSFLSTLLLTLPPSMTWHSHKGFHQSQGVAGTTMNMIKKQIQNLNRPFFFPFMWQPYHAVLLVKTLWP